MTAAPDPVLMSLAETLSDRYTIDREIGRGGMARVYVARDSRHDRDVAIKVLDPHLGSMLGGDRFLREIQLTAQLTHPHIIAVLDSGRAGDLFYYVTPYAPGESLRARLQHEAQLPVRDALRIAREIADALDAAHRAGVVHRDIKPENVLIVADHAVVCDFGIARAVSLAGGDSLTATGVSLGTPSYMAPEQVVAARDVDARADIYALGCVLYEMLAGDPPFTGANAQRIMAQHATSPPPSVRLARPAVSEEIDRVLDRALQKTPADRFGSAHEMRDAIDAILERGETTSATAHGTPSRPLPRRRMAIAIGIGLVAIGASAWLWLGGRPSSRSAIGAAASRVAVLPMSSVSADRDDRTFADGMTEELISTLSSIAGVRVIARSSVVSYADTKKTPVDIGRELGVGSIVETTFRRLGRQLHITVRLIDAATNEYRWSESYDREETLANIFTIQREIATTVAQKLSVRLLPTESERVARQPTTNLEAYGLYLRAQLLRHDNVNRPTLRAALDTATGLLRRAVALDPTFAEPHAALAQVYITILFNWEPGSNYRRLAADEIASALAIDPTLAEAYYARGDLAFTRESGWQLEDAVRDYRHALALKPNAADIHAAYGTLLFHVGLLDTARRELETTIQLDPVNRFVPPRISRVMWYGGQYDSALARMKNGIGFSDEYAHVLGILGRAADGLTALDAVPPAQRSRSDIHAARAVLLARLGRRTEAEAEIRAAIPVGPTASHFHHAEFMIGAAYSLLGNTGESLRWLERMADNGMPNYALLVNDPSLANVRSTGAFQEFLARERVRHARLEAILAEPLSQPRQR